ncbi:MAG: YeeE/YedE family protein [Hyphomicrobium sp.]
MAATEFTPVASAAGGALIGVAAVLLMLLSGRIAGVSGIVGRLLPPYRDGGVLEALAFVLALVAGAARLYMGEPGAGGADGLEAISGSWSPRVSSSVSGRGSAGDARSGHGVCGLSRLSPRSLAATLTFMATGFATVFVARHVLGS